MRGLASNLPWQIFAVCLVSMPKNAKVKHVPQDSFDVGLSGRIPAPPLPPHPGQQQVGAEEACLHSRTGSCGGGALALLFVEVRTLI